MRAARSAAQLKHPGIVLLYGTGQTEDGTHYLVEEFIDGTTLSDRLEASRFNSRRAVELVAAIDARSTPVGARSSAIDLTWLV